MAAEWRPCPVRRRDCERRSAALAAVLLDANGWRPCGRTRRSISPWRRCGRYCRQRLEAVTVHAAESRHAWVRYEARLTVQHRRQARLERTRDRRRDVARLPYRLAEAP